MNQIPFRIVGLQVEDFRISQQMPQDGTPIEVRTNYEFGVNPEQHLVMAKLTYTYLQNDTEYLSMVLVSSFDVKTEAFATMLHDSTFTLQPFFSQYLSTINVGAARGEIHARCEKAGSALSNVILPPINLVEALPEPIVITLQ